MDAREFQIKKAGMVVAGCCGERAYDEMLRMAVMYAEDGAGDGAGEVTIQEKVKGRWRNFANVVPASTGDIKEFATWTMPTPSGCGPIGETK